MIWTPGVYAIIAHQAKFLMAGLAVKPECRLHTISLVRSFHIREISLCRLHKYHMQVRKTCCNLPLQRQD